MKFLKIPFALSVFLFFSNGYMAQNVTNTSSDGDWFTGSNWTSGVPSKEDTATVTNNMTIDGDIEIDDGSFTIAGGTAIDPAGGSSYKITIQNDGYFEVDGDVTLEGDLELKNFGELIIKGCDTVTIGGDAVIENNSGMTIESCGVLIIEGNLEIKNNHTSIIDGNVLVKGDLAVSNNATATGAGNIQVEGSSEITNSATLFGSTSDCSDCEYGSGGALPVQLIDFNAIAISGTRIKTNWETGTEINNDYFTVEYSTNGMDYNVGKVIKGSGNSITKQSYEAEFTVPQINDLIYVRLRQTDYDGAVEVFDPEMVRPIKGSEIGQAILTKNPGNGENVTLIFPQNSMGYELVVLDIRGQELHHLLINSAIRKGEHIDLPNLSSHGKGIYLIRLVYSNQTDLLRYIVQ